MRQTAPATPTQPKRERERRGVPERMKGRKRPAPSAPLPSEGARESALQASRKTLPIYAYRVAILQAVRQHKTTIVVAETGSGKSTQLPQYLYGAGMCSKASGGEDGEGAAAEGSKKKKKKKHRLIVCTQPRRVAATTLARRVAEEMETTVGEICGYSVRFDDQTGPSTSVKFATDGVLLREAMSDPKLGKYSVIILDEAHERSLQTDILFGLVRRMQKLRSDLRVVIMSATISVDPFVQFFEDVEVVNVPGRSYPVNMYYTNEPQDDYMEAALSTCLQLHEETPLGDVLLFLPGRDDIESLSLLLKDWLGRMTTEARKRGVSIPDGFVCPLYAALPPEQQKAAFAPSPPGTRKFVLATNIAETSITVSGVRYVVDCGFSKQRRFSPVTGVESLRVLPISQEQATQRAGRAGREAAGMCYRLYQEDKYLSLEKVAIPEIQRANLREVVLQLKVAGIAKPETFEFLSPPPKQAIISALETLLALGALDETSALTEVGRKLSVLPLDPLFANFLLRSADACYGCTADALAIVSALSAEHIFSMPRPGADSSELAATYAAHATFHDYAGDLPTLANVLMGYEEARQDKSWCKLRRVNGRSLSLALSVKNQLAGILKTKLQIDPEVTCGTERDQLLRCLVAGFFLNVATWQNAAPDAARSGSSAAKAAYRTIRGGREVSIHPSSVLFRRRPQPKCVIFTELLVTSREYMKQVTAVDSAWLPEIAPAFYKRNTVNA